LRALISCTLLVLMANASSAQNADGSPAQVLRSTSTLVIVPTLVRSRSGELIKGLDAAHFRLIDNGREQDVFLERVENQPLAVVLLIQKGGAGGAELGNYAKLDDTIELILGASTNKLALVSFDSHVRQTWAFPPRLDGLYYGLTHQEAGDNGAAIRDAVRYAIRLLQNQPVEFRRVILLLSQDRDSGSQSSSLDVQRDVARSGSTIYSFTFPSDATKVKNHNLSPRDISTAELAVQSGGEHVQFDGESDLGEKMLTVGNGIRSGYILSFRPNSATPGLHTITVRVIEQNKRFQILARKSYWLE
jgi:hypothetical protein